MKNFPSVIALDDTGRYLGFEVSYEFGTMGMLHVVPEARGQGLGSYLTRQLAGKYFDQGLPVLVTVGTDNAESIYLHQKLGFRTISTCDLIFYKANMMSGLIINKA